jgi:hypothetical protein
MDAGRAAAQAGLLDFDNFQSGDGGKDPARLLEDSLRVTQMTRIMVCDTHG